MKCRPILFKGEMVRAILSGQKTQTRRIMKPQPYGNGFMHDGELLTFNDCLPPSAMLLDCKGYSTSDVEGWESECPYGQVGDQLLVKETFWAFGHWVKRFNVAKDRSEWHFIDQTLEMDRIYQYEDPTPRAHRNRANGVLAWFKRPSIFMPRHASRITLEITDVRAEQLQDISEEDAKAEGCEMAEETTDDDERLKIECGYFPPSSYAHGYRLLWESINGAGTWDANPWVWVVEFKRIDCLKEHLHG